MRSEPEQRRKHRLDVYKRQSQYTLQLLETAIQDSQTTYTTISARNERITMLQTVVVALCVALGCVIGLMVMRLLTPVQQIDVYKRQASKCPVPG